MVVWRHTFKAKAPKPHTYLMKSISAFGRDLDRGATQVLSHTELA